MKNPIKSFFRKRPEWDCQNREMVDYAIGVAGQNITWGLKSNLLEYYCTMILGINFTASGIFLWLTQGWDAINDPIGGMIIDRVHFKSGEKLRPFLKVLALPVGILAALLFVDWGFKTEAAAICYVGAIYLLFDLLYTFQDIAQWGMVARISNQPERKEFAAYIARLGGSIGGWLPGLILTLLGLSIDGVIPVSPRVMCIGLGIVYGVGGMALSLVMTKCRERAPVLQNEAKQNPLKDFKILFKNKIVITLTIANILNSCTLVMQASYFLTFMVDFNIGGYSLGLSLATLWGLVTGLPGMIAMFFAPKIAQKLGGMKNILVTATLTSLVCRIASFFCGYTTTVGLIFTILFFMILGIPNALTGIASTALWAESIDLTEYQTGIRNEGLVFSCQNFIAKFGSAMGSLMSGVTMTLLKMDAGYLSDCLSNGIEPVLSAEFTKYSWAIFCLGPALGNILYFIPLSLLKYNKQEMNKIAEELKKRRNASAEETTPNPEPELS